MRRFGRGIVRGELENLFDGPVQIDVPKNGSTAVGKWSMPWKSGVVKMTAAATPALFL